MPAFNPAPFPFGPAPKLLYAGVAEYFFGSWPQDTSPTKMYVTSVAIASNVATLGVVVYEGNVPAVGSLISVQGTQVNSEFNVTNAVLTAVSIPTTGSTAGTGTVSFALTGTNVSTTADAGMAIVPQPELSEAIAAQASVVVAMAQTSAGGDLDRTVTAVCEFPTLPTAVTVSLQGSMFNDPTGANFVTLGTIATVAAGAVTANGLTLSAKWLYYRALVSGLTGTGQMICRIAGA